MTLTALEREVLGRVVRGEWPWNPGSATRAVSQALGRLQKKGAIRHGEVFPSDADYAAYVAAPKKRASSYWATTAGKAAFQEAA